MYHTQMSINFKSNDSFFGKSRRILTTYLITLIIPKIRIVLFKSIKNSKRRRNLIETR